jgi:hypothetical protein
VTNPDGQVSTGGVLFAYVGPDPIATIVDPPVTSTQGGARLLVVGSNLVGGISVAIGGVPAAVQEWSPNLLTVIAPARPAGPAILSLTNPGDAAVNIPGLLTYSALAPSVAKLVPSHGPVTGGTLVTVVGTNFAVGQTTVTLGGQSLANVSVIDPTRLTFVTPATPSQSSSSTARLVVTTPSGRFEHVGFTYETGTFPPPTIVSVTPERGSTAGGTTVTIATNQSDAWVFFDGIPAASVVAGTGTLVATTPPHAAGVVDLMVSGHGGQTTRAAGFTYETPVLFKAPDFDGDLITDVSVYRPSTGQWFVLGSASAFNNSTVTRLGAIGDVPMAGDFDGDRIRDHAVYRPSTGTWFWTKSSTSDATDFGFKGWGLQAQGDVPVPGDYDGDGKADPTVFRATHGTWFALKSSTGFATFLSVGWGSFGDQPVPGDYDGDRTTDIAVYRPSTGQWFIRTSSSGFASSLPAVVFGQSGDVPVHGDFDGDGKKDVAVYRPSTGTWFVLRSASNNTQYVAVGWGVQAQGDVPVPGDYDGDGRTDICVYRPQSGTWFVLKSTSSNTQYSAYGWGAPTDTPLGGQR